ncbi:MAG: hybrid sensor histidine kinase/response regulator [Desulfobulbaceae bacterium]
MTVSWLPVIAVDVFGSLLTLSVATVCAWQSWLWIRRRPDDTFRDYIFLLTLAFVFFAVSRSVGHLVKQALLYFGHGATWALIAPYSGSVNTAAFIVVFAFGIYFQRFQKVHLALRDYKDNLELLVAERTRALDKENRQRMAAQEELRQANATLENIFASASPLCITGMDYQLLRSNEAYRRIWPGGGHDGTPLTCSASRPSRHCHTPDCPLEQIRAGRDEVVGESIRHFEKMEDRVFLQTTRPFRDADGKLVGTVTSFQEITARKRAQEELAAERERLAVTLRSIGDGVITTDVQGRVVMLNRMAEQLCGWRQDEAQGRPLHEVFRIVAEEGGGPVANPVDKVLATGTIVSLSNHTELVARDGTRRSIADSGAPIRDAQSRIIGVVLVFRDVTDRRRLEKEMLKNQKLESVGLLAGGIAHDFNNILAAILGNIDLALHRLGDSERVGALLVEAEKASLRAKGLTQQLLTFAKGGSPVRRTVSIAGVAKDSAQFILRGSPIRCELDFPEELWLVDIDPGQISQVVQNIILNARESMPEGGSIQVRGRNLSEPSSDGGDPRDLVEITLADQGPGISPEIIDKLFDPYFTTKKKGSGLGLAICHSIVSQHGGTIGVASVPGEGATFTIRLPASRNTTRSDEDATAPSFSLHQRKQRVLLMDDDEMVIDIAREMLNHLGHEVEVAGDGKAAVDLYQEALSRGQRFDAVILDLTVPGGMGGKEAVRELLSLDPNAQVIVSSGYSNDPVMADHVDYGFCAAVVKPFRLEDLAAAMEKALATGSMPD